MGVCMQYIGEPTRLLTVEERRARRTRICRQACPMHAYAIKRPCIWLVSVNVVHKQ